MKGRIIGIILILILLVGGLFLPTKSGLTDAAEPESNPMTVFSEAEEKAIAEEESKVEEEKQAAREESVSGLSDTEQMAYAWAALRSEPESILLMRDHISEMNQNWISACGGVNILEVPEWKAKEVLAVLTQDQSSLPDATTLGLTPTVYNQLKDNQNLSGSPRDLRLGIVLNRTALKVLPGTEAPDLDTLICTTPVWILHQSVDSAWYYVQTSYQRGWVSADAVAYSASKDVWLSYVAPESRIILTTPQLNQEGVTIDMGACFSCLEEGSDNYTVLLPIRKNDGSLDAKQLEVSRENSSFGYEDYTWTRVYKQIYRLFETKTEMSNETLLRAFYRIYGIGLPQDLAASFDQLGTVTELSSMLEDERENTMNSVPAPALIEDAGGLGLMLGRKDGTWQCMRVVDGTVKVVEIQEPVRMVVIK